jgi:D-alanyl-D-alanine carboxypeptidase
VLVPGAPAKAAVPVEPERPATRAKAVAVAAAPAQAGLAAPARIGSREAPKPAGAPAGPFQIQVGAFNTQDEAERRLAWVRERAGAVLGAHTPRMIEVKRGDKVLFRARYVGFAARAAAAGVCTELKRLEIECLVAMAEK